MSFDLWLFLDRLAPDRSFDLWFFLDRFAPDRSFDLWFFLDRLTPDRSFGLRFFLDRLAPGRSFGLRFMNMRLVEEHITRRKCSESVIERCNDRFAVLRHLYRFWFGLGRNVNSGFLFRFFCLGFGLNGSFLCDPFADRCSRLFLFGFDSFRLMNGRLIKEHISR